MSIKGNFRMVIEAGTRVRIKQDAFLDSDDPECLHMRGQTGTLILRIGVIQHELLWVWKGDNGRYAYLLDHEFEAASRLSDFPI